MSLPSWLSGGFRAVKGAADRAYGTADKIIGGVLPGGADNPYIGTSVDKRKQEQAVQFLRDYGLTQAVSGTLNQIQPKALNIFNKLNQAKNYQVPLTTIEKAREFVRAKVPGGIKLEIVPSSGGYFNSETGNVGLAITSGIDRANRTVSSPVALHEFGHALNFGERSPAQFARNALYGTAPEAGKIMAISAARGSNDEDRSMLQSGIEGALGNLVSPGIRHTLSEEALASARAVKMAHEFGLPQGKRLLGTAFATYAGNPLAVGFGEGVAGELGSRAANYLANFITDNITDPVADKLRGSEYTPLEEGMRKYGYDENKYRLKASPGLNSFEVQSK
jgi:hypothetical protein